MMLIGFDYVLTALTAGPGPEPSAGDLLGDVPDAQPKGSHNSLLAPHKRHSTASRKLSVGASDIPTEFRGHSLMDQVKMIYQARKLSAISEALDNHGGKHGP